MKKNKSKSKDKSYLIFTVRNQTVVLVHDIQQKNVISYTFFRGHLFLVASIMIDCAHYNLTWLKRSSSESIRIIIRDMYVR